MRPTAQAHIALFLTNLFFAINYTGIKFLTQNEIAGPFGINFLRVAGCVLLFWLLFLFRKEKVTIQAKDLFKMAVCAFAAIAANQMLFIKGLSLSSPLHASLLTLTVPILITFFASVALKEGVNAAKIAGLALSLAGAIFLLSGKGALSPTGDYVRGDLLIIASSVAYAYYFIIVKPLMDKYSPLMVTRWIFTFGLLMIWPFCMTELSEIRFATFSSFDWLLMIFIVVPGTFLAYIFNVYGIKILSTSVAGTYIYTQPLMAGAIAALALGERITLLKIIAALFIFSGLYLAQKSDRKNIMTNQV